MSKGMWIIEKREGDAWTALLDGVTGKPIEFGRQEIAVGVAQRFQDHDAVPYRAIVRANPETVPVRVTRDGPGVYRYGDYLIEHAYSPGEGWLWVVTDQGGQNWVGTFKTLREARVYIAEVAA